MQGQFPPSGFVLSLNSTDRIRMIAAPPEVTQCVRDTIVSFWKKGIQKEQAYYGSWDFKLKGTPWWANGTEAVQSRLLITKIVEALLAKGWIAQIGIEMTRKDQDKNVLMFQRSTVPPAPVLCLDLNENDKLRLINAPQNVIDTFRQVVQSKWLFRIQRENPYDQSWEIKLNGNPWIYGINGHDSAHGRVLLCFLLQAFAQLGWRHVFSADMSAKYVHHENGPDYPIDVHSWWFMYDPEVATQTQYSLGHQYGPLVGQSQSFAPPPPGYSAASTQQYGLNYQPVPGQLTTALGYPRPQGPPPSYDAATKNW